MIPGADPDWLLVMGPLRLGALWLKEIYQRRYYCAFEPTPDFESIKPMLEAANKALLVGEPDKHHDLLVELAAKGLRLIWADGQAEPRPDKEGSLQLVGGEMIFRPDNVWLSVDGPIRPSNVEPAATQPEWSIPDNLLQLVDDDEGGIWEDNTWDPILLTVQKHIIYHGRPIPLAWQIEFEPFGPGFEAANETLRGLGLDADGYGWATLIKFVAEKSHPDIAKELQFGDTEASTCVVWVESEAACHQLIEMTWALIHALDALDDFSSRIEMM